MKIVKKIVNHFFSLNTCYLFGIDDVAAAMIIGGAVSAISSVGTNMYNSNQQNQVNKDNLDFQKLQFLEQQTLNRKGYQIQVADMQKAGLNPATLNGGNLSAGSYSSTSEAPQVSDSGFQTLVQSLISAKTQESITKMNNDTAKDINNANIASNEKIEAEKLAQQKHQFQMSYDNEVKRIANETKLTDEQVRKLISDRALVESSFDGQEINNESALRDLFNQLRAGFHYGDKTSSVVGAVIDMTITGAFAIKDAVTGDDFDKFKVAYREYLQNQRKSSINRS